MKIKREVWIGLLGVVSLLIAIFGTKFLLGKKIFTTDNVYYVEYEDGQMVNEATPVLMSGIQVGGVRNLYLKPENQHRVIVELYIKKNIKIPKNTVASIISTGLMGGKAIQLEYTGACSGKDCAQDGDMLQGRSLSMFESMIPRNQLNEYMGDITSGLGGLIDTLGAQISNPESKAVLPRTLQDMQATMHSLKSVALRLDQLIAGMSTNLTSMSGSLAGITKNLNANNDHIEMTLANLDKITGQLAQANAGAMVTQAQNSLKQMETTLTTVNNLSMQLNNLMQKINTSKGSLGLLVNDKSLYLSLKNTSENLNLLSEDLRLNPGRYIALSLFGKKQVPYTPVPENNK